MSLWSRLFGRRKQADPKPQADEDSTPHGSSTPAQEFSEEGASPDIPPSPPFQSPIGAKQPSSPPPPHDSRGAGSEHGAFTWKGRPIFFSSTFKDMHAERDFLRDHTFPRLAERLRERCHYLDTIDLRQGVESAYEADEGKRELQVLTVCLDEIERSKPFLVALLGDRYGWIPPVERITAAARSAGLPESVEVAGKSVTELEILYGVLANPDQGMRSWFYFRTLDRIGMPPEVADRFPAEEPGTDAGSPFAKLQKLKDRIRRQMPDRVRDYTLRWDDENNALTGLKELDAQVESDLWSDLDAETAAYLREAPRTWQEAEARAVADVVSERIRGYVQRPALTTPMVDHALSADTSGSDWGLVVTGESGGGKSSLFGSVFQSLQPKAASGEILLLSHAAGIFPMSGQVDRMLRRWVGELASYLQVEDPMERPAATASEDNQERIFPGEARVITSEQIEKTFATLLSQAAARIRVVVLIDALNQFEATIRAKYLTWLPRDWPSNARFVATAIAGTASETLKKRPGCRELVVPPVSREEARLIAERFSRERYHRDVNPRVLDALLDKKESGTPAHGNPLWLSLALQEMNLLEADDYERAEREFAHLKGAQRMEALQLAEAAKIPGDVPGAYGELLDRAERLFGKAWTRSFTDLIALGRAGWRESDLQAVMPQVSGQPWDNLAFAGLRRTLGSHVVQRGGHAQWDFFHAALRETVLRRNLADETTRRHLHGLLADYLQALEPDDAIRISETMVHLLGLGDRDQAAEFIAEVAGSRFFDSKAKAALAGAVAVLVEAIRTALDEAARDRLTIWIAALMDGEYPLRSGFVAQTIIYYVNDLLAVSGAKETELSRGKLLEASSQMLQLLAASDPSNAEWQHDLSMCQLLTGVMLGKKGDLSGALSVYQESMEIAGPLATADPSKTIVQHDLWLNHGMIGDVLRRQGDLVGALRAYQESMGIAERLATADPSKAEWQHSLSVSHGTIGDVLRQQGDLAGALRAYRESMVIAERLAEAHPSDLSWKFNLSATYERIGCVLRDQSDQSGALRAYRQSLAIREGLAALDPSKAEWQHSLSVSHGMIGDMLCAQGDLVGALRAYQESMGIAERLATADPSNAEWQHDLSVSHGMIGDMLGKQGDLVGALRAYRESLAISKRLAALDPSNTQWQHSLSVSQNRIGDMLRPQLYSALNQDRLGDMLHAQGNLVGALRAYGESLAISERLAALDPSNAQWQRDLSKYIEKIVRIGNTLLAQGDLSGALRAFRESLAISERLAVSDPSNAQLQLQLSFSKNGIGDILRAQGDLAGALRAYRESLDISERLTASDPSNAQLQQLLSMSHGMIGDILGAQGDLSGAMRAHRESLKISERLAASDPSNAQLQLYLFVSYYESAQFAETFGQSEATIWWGKAYATLSDMKRRGILQPTDEQYLTILKRKLGIP
jgi:tetratricopeptide (TPR) repeat protein